MNWKDIALRIRALLFRRRVDEELEEELQFHLEMQSRKNRVRVPDKSEAGRLGQIDRVRQVVPADRAETAERAPELCA